MQSFQSFAPGVLADVIRRQPASPARTTFAWSVAVGPALARATEVALHEGVLRVTAKDARWGREIQRASATILPRLQSLLGHQAVTRIDVTL